MSGLGFKSQQLASQSGSQTADYNCGFANAGVLGTVTCYLTDEPGVPYNQSYLKLEKEMYCDKLENKQNQNKQKTYKLASRTRSAKTSECSRY